METSFLILLVVAFLAIAAAAGYFVLRMLADDR